MELLTLFQEATPTSTSIPADASQGAGWTFIGLDSVLAFASVVLSVALLWTGIRKPEASSQRKATPSVIDLALVGATVYGLGWYGLALLIAANLIAFGIISIRKRIEYEDILTDASIQGAFQREELEALENRLRKSGGAFKAFGPIKIAYLINYLSKSARSIPEIELMTPHIAALWIIFRPDLEVLTEKFDRLLRLSGTPADESRRLADVLTAGTQKSAAKFEELLDSMIAFYSQFPASHSRSDVQEDIGRSE